MGVSECECATPPPPHFPRRRYLTRAAAKRLAGRQREGGGCGAAALAGRAAPCRWIPAATLDTSERRFCESGGGGGGRLTSKAGTLSLDSPSSGPISPFCEYFHGHFVE